jgi:ketosteroid isomerase-like protein
MTQPVNDGKSVLERFFTAGDAGDLDSFASYLHHDVIVHAPMGLSTVGLAAEQESWHRAKTAMHDLHHEFLTVLQNGRLEAARCVVTGTFDGTYGTIVAVAKPFRVDQALFAQLRDGKIAELWEIVDTASLLDQLSSNGDLPPR